MMNIDLTPNPTKQYLVVVYYYIPANIVDTVSGGTIRNFDKKFEPMRLVADNVNPMDDFKAARKDLKKAFREKLRQHVIAKGRELGASWCTVEIGHNGLYPYMTTLAIED